MSSDKETLQAVLHAIENGGPAALATVVRAVGSTPRHMAAKMVIHPDGSSEGSIGGGSLEFQVVQDAQQTLPEGRPRLIDYSLIGKGPDSLGLCGGTEEVFIDVFRPGSDAATGSAEILRELIRALEEGERVGLATVVRAEDSTPWHLGAKMVIHADGSVKGTIGGGEFQSSVVEEARRALQDGYPQRLGYMVEEGRAVRLTPSRRADVEVFIDVPQPKPTLLIFGAGHIGQALAKLGKLLDMHVVVVDDRPDYSNPERLPEADEIVLVPYDAEKETLGPIPVNISPATHVVIATWGWDEPALRRVVCSNAAYIGLVASLRKAIIIFDDLRQEGIPNEALVRVRTPVGLDLKAETPAEIALSIMAEILMVKRGGTGRPLIERKGHPTG